MNTITINIFEDSEEGFQYDIYESAEAMEECKDPLDGGTCTSTIENALEMAYMQAQEILKAINSDKSEAENSKFEDEERLKTICAGCGGDKQLDLVVCWNCYKYSALPFKYYEGGLKNWLLQIKK